jgi:hypothetical protein
MLHKQVRAAEYRRLSGQESALAESSALENVREKHEIAAERWATLAALDEDPEDIEPPKAPDRGSLRDGDELKGL